MEVKMNTKEKKIKDIAFELIPKKLRVNFLNLISDVCVNKTDIKDSEFCEEMNEYLKIIERFTAEFNDILSLSMDKREEFLKEINEAKNKIKKIAQSFFIYDNFKRILFELFNEEYQYRAIKENDDFDDWEFDYNSVIDDCFEFIYEGEGDTELNEEYVELIRKSKIISCIPLKLTKAKYNDYLKNSLSELFADSTKNTVNDLTEFFKHSFAPFNAKEYGKHLHYIGDKFLALFDIEPSELSDDDIKKNIELLIDMEKAIDENKEMLTSFYNDLNYIQNLTLFCVDSEYLFEDDIMFKDLYFTVKNIIEARENEVFIDDILDRAYDEIESMENEITAMDKNFADILDMIDIEKVPEDVYTYVMTKIRIDENFNEDLSLSMMNYFDTEENDVLADEQFLNVKINEFLDFVKDSCSKIPNKKAKKIKAMFLGNIICSMSSEEYEEYIEYVIKSLEGMERGAVYLYKLSELFEKEGFYEGDYDIGDYTVEHDCHDHCGCGHHH